MIENHEQILAAVVLTTSVLKELQDKLDEVAEMAKEVKNEYRASAIMIDLLCCQEALGNAVTLADNTFSQIRSEGETRTVEEFINELHSMKAEPNPLVEPFVVYNLAGQYNKILDDLVEGLTEAFNS